MEFDCGPRGQRLRRGECAELFVGAFSDPDRGPDDPCYLCRHGAKTRIRHVHGVRPTEGLVDALLEWCDALSAGEEPAPWVRPALGRMREDAC